MALNQAKLKSMAAKTTATRADFKALDLSDAELNNIEKFISANGINWTTLWQLVIQYGPQVVAFILALFGSAPAPATP